MLTGQTILWLMWRSWPDREIASDWELIRRFASTNEVIYVDLQQKYEMLCRADGFSWCSYVRAFLVHPPERISDNLVRIKAPPMLPLAVSLLSRVAHDAVARLSISLSKKILENHIKLCLAELGLSPSILWMHSPYDFPLVGRFGERLVCYRTSDEIRLYPENTSFRTLLDDIERENIARVQLVFASSRSQYEKRKAMHPHTYLLPNGVDFDLFSQARAYRHARPPDMREIRPPAIGFMGAIDHRFDFELVQAIARARPGWSIVLLGLVRRNCSDKMDWLLQLPNVHWLGRKSRDELPGYLGLFDAAMIPYRVTTLTNTMYPWKLHEYLAAGLPVISTPLHEVRFLSPPVRLAQSAEEAVNVIEQELAQDCAEERAEQVDIARANSWDVRVEAMQALIEEAVG